jgi:LytR cell envelope-related transcriptional attenuator
VEFLERIGYYVGTAAFLGLALLIPLYLSQSRDLRRLRLWMEYDPEAPSEAEEAAARSVQVAYETAVNQAVADAAASRAARRAERAAARGEPPPSPAAERVAAERPAAAREVPLGPAERVMREGTTVYPPESAWRRWLRRGPSTRELLWVMAAAFLLGVLIVGGSQLLLSSGGDDAAPTTTAGAGVVKEEVEVAVLNGTAVPGLAARVGDDVEANGYTLGAVTNSEAPAAETVVLYERGHEQEAHVLARDLGVEVVQLIDPESRDLAVGADVVVVAGEDRAQA